MRRALCLFLSIVCVLQLSQVVLAAEMYTPLGSQNKTTSFIDSEGKENVLETTVLDSGEIIVKNYIEGRLADSSRTKISDKKMVTITTTLANGETITQEFPVSKYNSSKVTVLSNEGERAAPTYTYAGKITFLGHYEGYAPGTYHTHTLNMYEYLQSVTDDYRDIDIGVGTSVTTAIGIVASVLVGIALPELIATEIASSLVMASISSLEAVVIGGVVQSYVYKRYYVRSWRYFIKATDPSSGNTKYYNGEEYRVLLEGNIYSSELYYSGKRNWWTNNVIVLMWPDFWSCTYPGVSSVTRA